MNATETQEAVNYILKKGEGFTGRYTGNDNYGTPKQVYLAKLVNMTDAELHTECESKIWLSAYASNNHRSDYHWQCNGCYDECTRRDRRDIYGDAHKEASR